AEVGGSKPPAPTKRNRRSEAVSRTPFVESTTVTRLSAALVPTGTRARRTATTRVITCRGVNPGRVSSCSRRSRDVSSLPSLDGAGRRPELEEGREEGSYGGRAAGPAYYRASRSNLPRSRYSWDSRSSRRPSS